MQFLVSIAAVVAMTSVLLVSQMGQPRIWMSMSRDGLLCPAFQKVHPKYNTPSFATIVLASMLFAFVISRNYFSVMFNFDFNDIADYRAWKISYMDVATPNITLIIFWASALLLSAVAFFKKYSMIPLMGLITCMYLLTGMTRSNWAWFLSWLAVGLVFYFLYGRSKIKLALMGND